jgi:hypothetical protein
MDHYIPKRRVPVTLWSSEGQGTPAHVFLDLDANGRHPTLLEKLNEASPFLPVAVGPEGRIHLFNRRRIVRVTPGRQVIQSDVFARGFLPWREEDAELVLVDGLALEGKVWMPLARETQRLSDYMNSAPGFFVVLTAVGVHLVHHASVAALRLSESAGAPLEVQASERSAAA